jgi:hypothetical protein
MLAHVDFYDGIFGYKRPVGIVCVYSFLRPMRRTLFSASSGLAWVMDNLVEGHVINKIVVDKDDARLSQKALDNMLQFIKMKTNVSVIDTREST